MTTPAEMDKAIAEAMQNPYDKDPQAPYELLPLLEAGWMWEFTSACKKCRLGRHCPNADNLTFTCDSCGTENDTYEPLNLADPSHTLRLVELASGQEWWPQWLCESAGSRVGPTNGEVLSDLATAWLTGQLTAAEYGEQVRDIIFEAIKGKEG